MSNIEQDPRSTTNWNPLIAVTAMILLVGLAVIGTALWLNNPREKSDPKAQLLKARQDLTNAIEIATHWFNRAKELAGIAQEKQRHINEVYRYSAAFLTNAHIYELELGPDRIAISANTNIQYLQEWAVTVTKTNIIAQKIRDVSTSKATNANYVPTLLPIETYRVDPNAAFIVPARKSD